ncbi:MAG TPA: hypothetical protein VGN95_03190 [Pyrinomonadaceae bacterium]|jgi:hypothetical protein|nr:hypothetical protein [Pyrinomonadaceae bacterium]
MVDEDNKEKESGTRAGTSVDSRVTEQKQRPDSSQDATRAGTKVDSRSAENKTGKEDKSSSEPPDTMRGS